MLALMAALVSIPATTSVVSAQQSGYSNSGQSSIAEREKIRRQEAVREADVLFLAGREAFQNKDFEKAVDNFTNAELKISGFGASPMVADRKSSYNAHLVDAKVALAQKYRSVGKYNEARELLSPHAATNPLAKRELDYIDDPIRSNPALTYEHVQNVDQVRRGLYMAEGHYNLGKFDDAKKEYEKVIRIDPYNTAARRGMERIASRKSDYYRAAYDHTRAELLMQVDEAWELAVPVSPPDFDSNRRVTPGRPDGSIYISEKLRRIIIPRINFEDTTVEEAIDFLRQRSRELDNIELDPDRKGVNFVIRRPRSGEGGGDAGDLGGFGGLPIGQGNLGAVRIRELRLSNVPLAVALQYICDAAGLRYRVDDFAVTLVPAADTEENVTSRSFIVPPDFRSIISESGGGVAAADPDPFAAPTTRSSIVGLPPIKDALESAGVSFGAGTSAILTSNGVLNVTNTPLELDKVEQLVEMAASMKPKQVKITTKFVEISQQNSDELGFDWIVSPFGSATGNIFGSGGTTGSGVARTGADFTAPAIPGIPVGPGNVSNILTAGLRSGDTGLNRNSLNAVLNNPNRSAQNTSVAPGIASITGVFSDGAVQMIMRGLAQKKGTDLMTAPSVTARSGDTATIEIIREFIYPTDYDPPQIPQQTGGGNFGGGGVGGGGLLPGQQQQPQSFPVTPANPTAFEMEPTGVRLEIQPTIGDNDFVIDLQLAPEIVEFEGFINYGSPIQTTGLDALGNPVPLILTENRIEMPVFSRRRVKTALTIYDGYTVAIGGLMREDVQNVEDKVPILGDIPIIGRLFQSKSENRIKSNLIVFVTAQIIDATGRPLRGADAIEQPSAFADGPDFDDGVLPPMPVGF
jgi:general secretion pathway protein D